LTRELRISYETIISTVAATQELFHAQIAEDERASAGGTVMLHAKEERDTVIISVSDTGVGMTAKQQKEAIDVTKKTCYLIPHGPRYRCRLAEPPVPVDHGPNTPPE
jgi:anti-sigma regulatory factor (Ser/Thr protein kinase)